jgi:hypothetical protein
MERIHHRDKPQEGTTNSTGKAKKAGPSPWNIEQYTYKGESIDDNQSSHCDPRLESHGLDQDHDFIPHDDDYGNGHPVLGTTTDLQAHDPSTSDLGTLAGGKYNSAPQYFGAGRPYYSSRYEMRNKRRFKSEGQQYTDRYAPEVRERPNR